MTPDQPTAPEPVDLPETAPGTDAAPEPTALPAPAYAAPVAAPDPAAASAAEEEPVEVTAFAEPPADEPAPEPERAPVTTDPEPASVAEPAPEPLPGVDPAEPGTADAEPVPVERAEPAAAEAVPVERAEPVAAEPAPSAAPAEVPAAPPPATDLPLADPADVPTAAEGDASPAYAGEGQGPRRRGPLVPVLTGLVVVLAALTGFLGWEAQRTAGAAPVVKTRDDAVASAREAARLVFSYDYRHLAKDFAAGKAVTTGDFSKEYDRTTAKLSDDFAPRYKAVVSADVSASSVVRESGDQVVCLVFVNQVSTSSLITTPKVTQSRLEMTMQKGKDGRWRVAKIDAL